MIRLLNIDKNDVEFWDECGDLNPGSNRGTSTPIGFATDISKRRMSALCPSVETVENRSRMTGCRVLLVVLHRSLKRSMCRILQ